MDAGKKHPLLVYRIRYRRNRGLYFVVAIALLAWYVALRVLPPETWAAIPPWIRDFDWLLVLAGLILLVIAILRLLASVIPYVQCSERNIKIQAPLYQVVFSYKRVRESRPNTLFHMFEKSKLSRGARNFVLSDQYGGHTAVVIEVNSWPMSVRVMRFWLGRLVFSSDNRALVLWVEDWMALNREISDYKDRWRERERERKRQAQIGAPSASLYQEVAQPQPQKKQKKK
jgi:hypothetical protein